MDSKMTQNQAVLQILRANENRWVPMFEIAKYTATHCDSMSFAVNSRVAELRKNGHNIENKVGAENGKRKSYYRLVTAKFLARID